VLFNFYMKDVQAERDTREIPLNKVGIKDLLYPIRVLDRKNKYQSTVATVNMYVDLPKEFRGTHMSRFIEVLEKHKNTMAIHNIEKILEDMRDAFSASTSHIELKFPYFIRKKAPVSGIESFMNYTCGLMGTKTEKKFDLVVLVEVPIHNLCPCSKEISSRGAHNQRGVARIQVRMKKLVWFEELVEMAESAASAPVFSLLKREDEKYITERAYDNPRFVEDASREIALALKKDERITWFKVEVENYESIHNHNAYACVEFTNGL